MLLKRLVKNICANNIFYRSKTTSSSDRNNIHVNNNKDLAQQHSYKETIKLPKTSFSMRSDSSIKEPLLQDICCNKLYNWQKSNRSPPHPQFVLHDGPPFANGSLHVGHLLNKVLKDIINRYKLMQGYGIQYFPGWDCHGLPIELKALEKLKIKNPTPLQIREAAYNLAKDAIQLQKDDFIRWGILADWDNSYMTMSPSYESNQLLVFSKMVEAGLIFRALKPVHWSPSSKTALAEAELEYNDNHKSQSIFVIFKLVNKEFKGFQHINFVIWTTTPWTIPANMALAVNLNLKYVIAENDGILFVIASKRLEDFSRRFKSTFSIVQEFLGSELIGIECKHPLDDRLVEIIPGSHVTEDGGTGIVHTAPGHGMDDYLAWRQAGKNGMLMFVSENGTFTTEAGTLLAGKSVFTDGNIAIIEMLKANGALLFHEEIVHRYPYDWRTKKPIIQRGSSQWFCKLDSLQKNSVKSLDDVKFIPETGKSTFSSTLSSRSEWCISRQRHWGLPIPVFYDENGNSLLDLDIIKHISNLFAKHGSSCWWEFDVSSLLPEKYLNDGHMYTKGMDTMDVWFDSGTAWYSALKPRLNEGVSVEKNLENSSSAVDLIVEGEDQYRGWFQSLMLTSMAVNKCPPYKMIVTHGFVLDEQNRKMSKSIGNVIEPKLIINGGKDLKKQPAYGADVMRLWVASTDYTSAVNIGPSVIEKIFDSRNKIRNVSRFLLGNISEFSPKLMVPYNDLIPVDKYMLHLMTQLQIEVLKDFENYNFLKVYRSMLLFINVHVSAFYSSIAKDRLYHFSSSSVERRSAQTVCFELLQFIVRTFSPIICHTMEEVYQNLNPDLKAFFQSSGSKIGSLTSTSTFDSVFAHGFIKINYNYNFSNNESSSWLLLISLREIVNKNLEASRMAKVIGSSLESSLTLELTHPIVNIIRNLFPDNETMLLNLEELLIVSELKIVISPDTEIKGIVENLLVGETSVNFGVIVTKSNNPKCSRCWKLKEISHNSYICKRCSLFMENYTKL